MVLALAIIAVAGPLLGAIVTLLVQSRRDLRKDLMETITDLRSEIARLETLLDGHLDQKVENARLRTLLVQNGIKP